MDVKVELCGPTRKQRLIVRNDLIWAVERINMQVNQVFDEIRKAQDRIDQKLDVMVSRMESHGK